MPALPAQAAPQAVQAIQALPAAAAMPALPIRERVHRPDAQVEVLARAANTVRPMYAPPLLISLETGGYGAPLSRTRPREPLVYRWDEEPPQVRAVKILDTGESDSCQSETECLVSSGFQVCLPVVGYSASLHRSYLLHLQSGDDVLHRLKDWDADMTLMLVYKRHVHGSENRVQMALKHLREQGKFRGVVVEALDWIDSTSVVMYRHTCIAFKEAGDNAAEIALEWKGRDQAFTRKLAASVAAGAGSAGSAAGAGAVGLDLMVK